MTADRVRDIIAQQRAVEARNNDRVPHFGDIAVAVVVAPVIAWAAIGVVVRLLP